MTTSIRRIVALVDTTVGQKTIVAVTGVALIGFVVMHMLGNLQMFLGPDAINGYAKKLQNMGALLWVARIGLIVAFVAHIAATIRLKIRNRGATTGRYAVTRHQASTRSSRTMLYSGLVILAFVVFHLLHFTFGVVQPASYGLEDASGRHDVYNMVVAGFRNWGIAGFYLLAMALLGFHLAHASYSIFQTLGLRRNGTDRRIKLGARGLAAVVAIGFASIPLAVLIGLIASSS